ncbi:hypothetical protein [Mangrovimonas xylaniphaga]|uniref:hypothetical protein n=1 Tax=Mangrovimonas xylaniphaga TaxID=1645915 RepID=UPI0006B5D051|nr:hypothetical protein [Mangrovimonas xylaniphaga]
MKKTFVFLCLFLVLFFSCSNDDLENEVGSWNAVEIYYDGHLVALACVEHKYLKVEEGGVYSWKFKDAAAAPESCYSEPDYKSLWKKNGDDYEFYTNPGNYLLGIGTVVNGELIVDYPSIDIKIVFTHY